MLWVQFRDAKSQAKALGKLCRRLKDRQRLITGKEARRFFTLMPGTDRELLERCEHFARSEVPTEKSTRDFQRGMEQALGIVRRDATSQMVLIFTPLAEAEKSVSFILLSGPRIADVCHNRAVKNLETRHPKLVQFLRLLSKERPLDDPARAGEFLKGCKNNPCSNCGETSGPRKVCSGCKMVAYCSRSCQKENWGVHRELCEILREGYKAAECVCT